MTDEVKRICRRWLALSALGALSGFVLVYGLWPTSAQGLAVAALPVAAVALAQAVALFRYRPAPGLALLWLLVTPAFIVVAYILGMVGFSGWRHVPSYREYAMVLSMVTTPVLLVLGLIQNAILKRWLGRAPLFALITAAGNVVALICVFLLAWLLESAGLMDVLGRDQLGAGAGAPLMFVLSAFQAISLKNLALHSEPFRRMA